MYLLAKNNIYNWVYDQIKMKTDIIIWSHSQGDMSYYNKMITIFDNYSKWILSTKKKTIQNRSYFTVNGGATYNSLRACVPTKFMASCILDIYTNTHYLFIYHLYSKCFINIPYICLLSSDT